MEKVITWDMDKTIADLYNYPNWLEFLQNEQTDPYDFCKPLINCHEFYNTLNALRNRGWRMEIVSWSSKGGSKAYNKKVKQAKVNWLKANGIYDCFDSIHVVKYGTKKHRVAKNVSILIDDDVKVRADWLAHGGMVLDPTKNDIITALLSWMDEDE